MEEWFLNFLPYKVEGLEVQWSELRIYLRGGNPNWAIIGGMFFVLYKITRYGRVANVCQCQVILRVFARQMGSRYACLI